MLFSMKKHCAGTVAQKTVLMGCALLALLVAGGFLLKKRIGSITIPKSETIVPGEGDGGWSELIKRLVIPDGFTLAVFADDLSGARVIEIDGKGRFLVSQPSEGKISVLTDTDSDGRADSVSVLLNGLDKPHGLAFACPTPEECFLYVAEYGALTRYRYDNETATAHEYQKLLKFPSSGIGGHVTRSLLFLPSPQENILLVSIGSSCNVCHEEDILRAKIIAYDTVTGKHEEYARGLRNAVFMTLNPLDGAVVATEMGRDGLGDDLPPDEINIVEKGKNYGWPICYGDNIHDGDFDKNTYFRNPCMEPFETPSFIDLPAHSAPLGLAFVPEEGWPQEYWYNLLVAYHGSWNRSEPTGYKIVRIKLNAHSEYLGMEDFISGWLTPQGTKIGRPVDVKIFSGGVVYISDDMNGMVYRLARTPKAPSFR